VALACIATGVREPRNESAGRHPGYDEDIAGDLAVSFADALDVLYEDNHLIAVNKPCGWPSAHFSGDEETMDRVVKAYLKEKYGKPGNVFLGVVHRLDKPVSGVLMFARTSKGAARLSEQFRDNLVEKVYRAVVETGDHKLAPAGTLEDWLRKDPIAGVVEVVPPETDGAKQAVLHYTTKAEHGGLTFLEIRPQTGRTHQLRVQFASRGWPIYGDRKYGSRFSLGPGIGLHAGSLTFLHPVRKEPITLIAQVPKAWRGRFAYLLQAAPPWPTPTPPD
jgi:23S rRNA pseudouridine1911/1915/1917 synthase